MDLFEEEAPDSDLDLDDIRNFEANTSKGSNSSKSPRGRSVSRGSRRSRNVSQGSIGSNSSKSPRGRNTSRSSRKSLNVSQGSADANRSGAPSAHSRSSIIHTSFYGEEEEREERRKKREEEMGEEAVAEISQLEKELDDAEDFELTIEIVKNPPKDSGEKEGGDFERILPVFSPLRPREVTVAATVPSSSVPSPAPLIESPKEPKRRSMSKSQSVEKENVVSKANRRSVAEQLKAQFAADEGIPSISTSSPTMMKTLMETPKSARRTPKRSLPLATSTPLSAKQRRASVREK